MKKNILAALIAIGASTAAHAQTAFFTNSTPCEIYVYVSGTDGTTCADNTANLIVIPGNQVTPVGYDMYQSKLSPYTPLTWAYPPVAGLAFNYFKYHEGDPASCAFVSGSSTCGKGGRMSFAAVEFCTPTLSSCIEISTSGCNMGCSPGNYVNATLTALGGGDVQVDFN